QVSASNKTIDDQIAAIRKQLDALPPTDLTDRAPLRQQIARLRALSTASGGGTQVIEPAVPNSAAVGPNTRRVVELALVIGILLGLGAVILAENADRRLRTPEDLERLTRWPLPGVIPPGAFARGQQN